MKRFIVVLKTYMDEDSYKIYISAKSRIDAYNKAFYFINTAYRKGSWLVSAIEE